MKELQALVDAEIDKGGFPGIVLEVAKEGKSVFSLVKGLRQVQPNEEKMTADTIFDLAELTQPLATALLTLYACGQEKISLERTLGSFIPEVSGRSRDVTLRQLLLHTGGFAANPDLHKLFPDPRNIDYEQAVRALLSIQPEESPGTVVRYSCTGYLFLGQVLRRISGARVQELFSQLVAASCKLSDTTFNPPVVLWGRVAASGYCRWRQRWMRGQVHDENSYCLGGEGGNAGLFATAAGVLQLLSIFETGGLINDCRLLSPDQVKMMSTCCTEGMGTRRSVGFMMGGQDSTWAAALGDNSFGHTGFTGTSIWFDPVKRIRVVLLTNSLHLGREQTEARIEEFRREIHHAVYEHFA